MCVFFMCVYRWWKNRDNIAYVCVMPLCFSPVIITAEMWAVYRHNQLINRLIAMTHLEGKLNGLQISRGEMAARRGKCISTAATDHNNASWFGMSSAE